MLTVFLTLNVLMCNASDCNCSSGYVPKLEDDKMHCVNLTNGKLLPCIPAPFCDCNEDEIRIKWGKIGEACISTYNISSIRVLPCKNKEEWKNFRNKLKEKV